MCHYLSLETLENLSFNKFFKKLEIMPFENKLRSESRKEIRKKIN